MNTQVPAAREGQAPPLRYDYGSRVRGKPGGDGRGKPLPYVTTKVLDLIYVETVKRPFLRVFFNVTHGLQAFIVGADAVVVERALPNAAAGGAVHEIDPPRCDGFPCAEDFCDGFIGGSEGEDEMHVIGHDDGGGAGVGEVGEFVAADAARGGEVHDAIHDPAENFDAVLGADRHEVFAGGGIVKPGKPRRFPFGKIHMGHPRFLFYHSIVFLIFVEGS